VKILLDECVDRRLASAIVGHEVRTARDLGWTTIKNGELLTLAAREFDVFVTVDRNLAFQQKIVSYNIAVIVLRARSNRLADLLPLVPQLLLAIPAGVPGRVVMIGSS
jgi:predicted nuclease of predicted toxin-antitoxin system